MSRTPQQMRFEACFHEAGHAVAAFLLGLRVERAHVLPVEEVERVTSKQIEADSIGQVLLDAPPADLGEAINHIVVGFAGEAASRVAWATGIVTDQQIGGTQIDVPDEELTDEQLLILSNGSSPVEKSVKFGFYSMPSDGDDTNARALAEQWTSGPLEKAALVGFCQARTSSLANTEKFQTMINMLGATLDKEGSLDGDLIHHLLDRADAVLVEDAP